MNCYELINLGGGNRDQFQGTFPRAGRPEEVRTGYVRHMYKVSRLHRSAYFVHFNLKLLLGLYVVRIGKSVK
jgi:hypothetical protein